MCGREFFSGQTLLKNPAKLLLALPCVMLVFYILLFIFGAMGYVTILILCILGGVCRDFKLC
ncbi:hypothetical protein CQA42_00855 [Helicobacter sp. MIT 99-5507]|nr:hypothetical protein CQA42_00855 [Helicobacter sp. MIT 99-5507]